MDLSIVVIGYNIAQYAGRCVGSILKQLTPDSELIFVDDGSTDDTANIIKKLFTEAKSHSVHCHYLYKENGGANSARIYGYKKSGGTYITFVDGDDWVDEKYIATILGHMGEQPDIIQFNYYEAYSNGCINKNKLINEIGYTKKEFLDAVFEMRVSHYLWDKAFKRSFLENIRFGDIPRITMGDDLAAHIRMGISDPWVINTNEFIYYYYNDGTGISRRPSKKTAEIIWALKDMEETLKNKGLYEAYKAQLDYHYFRSFLFYVVKNKYEWTAVQGAIYREWKNRKICFNSNYYIKEYMNDKKKEWILAWSYDKNKYLGRALAGLYLLISGKKVKT